MTNENLSPHDLELLSQQSDETLIQWALALNRWQWPEDLPDKESPEECTAFLLDRGGPGIRYSRRSRISRWIEAKVSKKRILRAHNHRLTDEEFEDFWRGAYEGDAEAAARDEARRHWDVRLKLRPWQEALCDEADFFDVFDTISR